VARTIPPSPNRIGGSLERDTIAAVATPPGRGGIGIVRISGPNALAILSKICGRNIRVRTPSLVRFRDAEGRPIDEGIALAFAAPHSFTGESVAELQGHGGPIIMDMLLGATLNLGARLARPGEFTERAFLNGKMDLAQAEAVADLIASRSEAAARSVLRSLSGVFSDRIRVLAKEMLDLRVYVEGAIDFPEDDVDFLAVGGVGERLERLFGALVALIDTATQGAILNEGVTLVLAGRPNVGKSSLLNRLLGFDRAIVTDMPGTTRDTLAESIDLGGVPVRVVDTAGLRIAGDAIEREGIRRTWLEVDEADLVLLVRDGGSQETVEQLLEEHSLPRQRLLVVTNKIDLTNGIAGEITGNESFPEVAVSALTGDGLDVLERSILRAVGYIEEAGVFSARRRHLDALNRARTLLERGGDALRTAGAGELLADDLRRAHDQLGEIVGSVSSDALLGEIFSRFCIGK
jgi:tRNA modification GTPase